MTQTLAEPYKNLAKEDSATKKYRDEDGNLWVRTDIGGNKYGFWAEQVAFEEGRFAFIGQTITSVKGIRRIHEEFLKDEESY